MSFPSFGSKRLGPRNLELLEHRILLAGDGPSCAPPNHSHSELVSRSVSSDSQEISAVGIAATENLLLATNALGPQIQTSGTLTRFIPTLAPVTVDPNIIVRHSGADTMRNVSMVVSFSDGTRQLGDELNLLSSDTIRVEGTNIFEQRNGQEVAVAEFLVIDDEYSISFLGTATWETGQEVARLFEFNNALNDPDQSDRIISFAVTDTEGLSSVATKRIEVTRIAPRVQFSNLERFFSNGSPPIAVDPQVQIEDIDSPDYLAGRFVATLQHRQDLEFLTINDSQQLRVVNDTLEEFVDGSWTLVGNLVESSARRIEVEFTDRSRLATVTLLSRHIYFGSNESNVVVGTRVVEYQVTDPNSLSGSATKTILVGNDSPEIGSCEEAVEFSEGDPPVLLNPRFSINDPDSPDFDGGRLDVVLGSRDDGDYISFRDSDDYEFENGDVVYVDGTSRTLIGTLGVSENLLRINFIDNATPSHAGRLAQLIQFGNDGDDINHQNRTVRLTIIDPSGGSATCLVTIEVTVGNIAPVLFFSNLQSDYPEDTAPDPVDRAVTIRDADGGSYNNAVLTASIVEGTYQGGDILSVVDSNQIQVNGTSIVYLDDQGGFQVAEIVSAAETLVIRFTNRSTPGHAELVGRHIGFHSTKDQPSFETRRIQFEITDPAGESASDIRDLTLSPVIPEVVFRGGATRYIEGDPAVRIDVGVRIGDGNNVNFDGGTLVADFADQTERDGDELGFEDSEQLTLVGDEIQYVPEDGAESTTIATLTNDGSALVFQFNANADTELVQLVGRHITFGNFLIETSQETRLVRFTATDSDGDEGSDVKEISFVQLPPVIEFSAGSTVLGLGDREVVIDTAVTVSDSDSENYRGGSLVAEITETSERQGDFVELIGSNVLLISGSEIFEHRATGEVLIANWGFVANRLEIGFLANANIESVQLVARHIVFGNDLNVFNKEDRFVRYTVTDPDGLEGSDVRRIEVTSVAPMIIASDGPVVFTKDGPPITIDQGIEISDTDSTNFDGGRLVVSFAENTAQSGDELLLRSSDRLSFDEEGIFLISNNESVQVAEYSRNTGSLTIEFNGNADPSTVQEVARHIDFGNPTSDIVGDDRVVRFTVIDPDNLRGSDLKRIEVEIPTFSPTVEFSDAVPGYDHGDPPVIIDPNVEIGDVDADGFANGTLVAEFVEDSFRDGDFLTVLSTNEFQVEAGSVFRVVNNLRIRVGEFEVMEEILTVRFLSDATMDDAQAVARQIAFGSNLDETSVDTRIVRLTATDSLGEFGSDRQRVSIAASNLEPLIEFSDEPSTFRLGDSPTAVDSGVEITDIEATDGSGMFLQASFAESSRQSGDFLTFEASGSLQTEGNDIFEQRGGVSTRVATFTLNASGIAITFHVDASLESVDAVARQIRFGNNSDNESLEARFIRFEVTDTEGATGSSVQRIDILAPLPEDSDGDGIHDDEEEEGPNDGDGNGDGIPDDEQSSVTTVTRDGVTFITVAVDGESHLENVRISDVPTDQPLPENTVFPIGLVELEIHRLGDDGRAVATIYLPQDVDINTLYFWGSTSDEPTPNWHPFLFDGQSGARLFAGRIEVELVDGQLGDIDLTENGIIRTAFAPGLRQTPWQNPWSHGDVNRDGSVTPLDALVVINHISRNPETSLPLMAEGESELASVFLDVSGDQFVTPQDALIVLNIIAQERAAANAEQTGSSKVGIDGVKDGSLVLLDSAFRQLF